MAAATSEIIGEYPLAQRGPHLREVTAPAAALPVAGPAAIMAEYVASLQVNERQAAQLLDQARTIGQLRSDLESNASEVIALKIREHRLISDLSRKMTELQSLRVELAAARSNGGEMTLTQTASDWTSEQDAAVEPMLGISGRWCIVTTSVAIVSALGAWALAVGFHW